MGLANGHQVQTRNERHVLLKASRSVCHVKVRDCRINHHARYSTLPSTWWYEAGLLTWLCLHWRMHNLPAAEGTAPELDESIRGGPSAICGGAPSWDAGSDPTRWAAGPWGGSSLGARGRWWRLPWYLRCSSAHGHYHQWLNLPAPLAPCQWCQLPHDSRQQPSFFVCDFCHKQELIGQTFSHLDLVSVCARATPGILKCSADCQTYRNSLPCDGWAPHVLRFLRFVPDNKLLY